ncbi:hypothetical protein [Actinoplanes sp. NBRC 103695]|uniref:LysM peptidoglycan-binding domain-containing protein n=1 Tax=Actinoplanes sp. NBRC 103695 TaxID=3032202 RepID=UPI0024A252B0|nr:hypothetical protein [Actinoplanes sp. NBRC 103695]GLY98653.1 hypothetical protein Acsp02_59070 [Actinoplanes sp. NBRC 103695]
MLIILRRAALLLACLLIAVVTGAATPAAAQRADPKWYEVRAEYEGEPEYLYEIADRFLGDGDRFTEIYALNKGRTQPDGLIVNNPEVIEPGWILILPDDAEGDGVRTGPLPVASTPPPPSSAPAATPPAVAAPATEETPTALIIAGALIVAAAVVLLVLLRRRKRPAPKPPVFDHPTTPTRTLHAAVDWTIDRALRGLAAAEGRTVPPIAGVSLDESRIVLRLETPDTQPIEPWKTTDEGRTWVASLRALQALPAAGDVPNPCPRLVTLGTTGGTRELLDLGRSTGVISIDGEAAVDVAAAWAEELISSPWSDRVRVVTGGLPVAVRSEQLTARDSISEALAATGGAGPGVLILGEPPAEGDLHRARGLTDWVVIVLGQTHYDHWRFTAHPDGRLDTGTLGIAVQARAL